MVNDLGPLRAIAVIPARFASTRVPGKPLADLAGVPMIERVYRRTAMAERVERVIVATDDTRIRDAVSGIAEVRMTSPDHQSGSDRVAEVVQDVECDIVINVQGDLPMLDPAYVDALIDMLAANPSIDISTAAVPVRSKAEFLDPSVVKVVCDESGRALYFSRLPIPHDRDDAGAFGNALHHVGLYAYRRETILRFSKLAPSRLEKIEKLEQLRALENGIGIGVVRFDDDAPVEVDTDEDLARARAALAVQDEAGQSSN
jgi:3-deoxy-manno-octulosonate cytidylyltransferase (CMP-KDO synthetase)